MTENAIVHHGPTVRERPITLRAHEVRGTLDGRQTQFRRIVRRPKRVDPDLFNAAMQWAAKLRATGVARTGPCDGIEWQIRCPYGRAGDRLWVRETWAPAHPEYHTEAEGLRLGDRPVHPDGRWCWYRATDGEVESGDHEDGRPVRWRPSIHMLRWASRITLEVTGVRVERLQDISDEDARAEGVEQIEVDGAGVWRDYELGDGTWCNSARGSFATLWRSIYGTESWDANPWVWVVEFRRVEE